MPATAQPPYRAPDLYPVAGTTNYTAVAEDGLAACNATGVFASSLVGDTGPILQQVLASFSEACPGTLTLSEQGLMTPQEALEYECGEPCVDWLINFGVCIATELKQVLIQLWVAITPALKHVPFIHVCKGGTVQRLLKTAAHVPSECDWLPWAPV